MAPVKGSSSSFRYLVEPCLRNGFNHPKRPLQVDKSNGYCVCVSFVSGSCLFIRPRFLHPRRLGGRHDAEHGRDFAGKRCETRACGSGGVWYNRPTTTPTTTGDHGNTPTTTADDATIAARCGCHEQDCPRRDGCSCDSTAYAGAIATAACGRRCCRCSTCSCTGTATGTTVALQRRCSTFAITCIAIARGESHHACKAGAGQLRQCRRFSSPCPNRDAGGYPCATIRKQECAQARMEQTHAIPAAGQSLRDAGGQVSGIDCDEVDWRSRTKVLFQLVLPQDELGQCESVRRTTEA